MPHAQIPAVLSHVDVLALPSVYEELGSVLVEAMRVGLPIVATQVGGIPDLITHGVNGLLVPSGNPRALAEAIGTLLDDPELARSLGEAGREKAESYSWPSLARNVEQAYRQVQGIPVIPGADPVVGRSLCGPGS